VLVVVGRIGRAHGLRGDVSIEVHTDEPETRFAPGAVLLTAPQAAGSGRSTPSMPARPNAPKTLTVESTRWHSSRLLARFVGVEDRTAAEALQGLMLQIDVDPAAAPEDSDEFYDIELEGMTVVADGVEVGTIHEVLHLPGQEVLVMHRTGGGEVLIPFVSEIVPDVDRASRRLTLADPGGLLDESEAEEA